jgi:hypothetical protein
MVQDHAPSLAPRINDFRPVHMSRNYDQVPIVSSSSSVLYLVFLQSIYLPTGSVTRCLEPSRPGPIKTEPGSVPSIFIQSIPVPCDGHAIMILTFISQPFL